MKRAAMKRAALKRAALKRAAMRAAVLCGFVLALVLGAGCEGDSGNGGGSDTAGNGADTSGGGGGDTGGGGGDTGGGPGPGACEQPELGAPQNEPWTQFEHEGQTYTQNACPEGAEVLQGAWAFFYPPDAEHTLGDDYRELLTFNGNTWQAHMKNDEEEGFVEGWYFCSQQPENDKAVWVFVVTEATPDGVFNNHAGDVFSADVLGREAGMTSFYMYYYDGIATQATDDDYLDSFYCRVGADLAEDEGEGCCENPFAE